MPLSSKGWCLQAPNTPHGTPAGRVRGLPSNVFVNAGINPNDWGPGYAYNVYINNPPSGPIYGIPGFTPGSWGFGSDMSGYGFPCVAGAGDVGACGSGYGRYYGGQNEDDDDDHNDGDDDEMEDSHMSRESDFDIHEVDDD